MFRLFRCINPYCCVTIAYSIQCAVFSIAVSGYTTQPRHAVGYRIQVCVAALYDVPMMMKSPNDVNFEGTQTFCLKHYVRHKIQQIK